MWCGCVCVCVCVSGVCVCMCVCVCVRCVCVCVCPRARALSAVVFAFLPFQCDHFNQKLIRNWSKLLQAKESQVHTNNAHNEQVNQSINNL